MFELVLGLFGLFSLRHATQPRSSSPAPSGLHCKDSEWFLEWSSPILSWHFQPNLRIICMMSPAPLTVFSFQWMSYTVKGRSCYCVWPTLIVWFVSNLLRRWKSSCVLPLGSWSPALQNVVDLLRALSFTLHFAHGMSTCHQSLFGSSCPTLVYRTEFRAMKCP